MGGFVLNRYRWQNRILMVLTDDETIVSRQKDILDQDIDGVLDRDLVVFGLGGERAPYLEDKEVDLHQVRDGFSLEDDDKIVLLGKDGSVKGTWGGPGHHRRTLQANRCDAHEKRRDASKEDEKKLEGLVPA